MGNARDSGLVRLSQLLVDATELRNEAREHLRTAFGDDRQHWSNVGALADEVIRNALRCGAREELGEVRDTVEVLYFDDPDHLKYALKKAE